MNIYLELIGYLGTTLILLSMMMTSVARLRLLNLAGSVASMIYAFACGTWPVFLLNFSLAAIHIVQLIRMGMKKEETE